MNSTTVSVIIPCYNGEKNLRQCINSVRNQTLKEIEIICVDDGSTDSTVDILKELQKEDPRIVLIQQKNAGAGAARNVGLDRATGKYLSFLDADDFFEPDMLEKSVAAAEKYEADYIVFRADRYYPADDRYEKTPWTVQAKDLPPYMPFSYRQLTDNVFLTFVGWAWDKLFRRSFVLEHNLWFQEQRTTNDMLFVFSALVCAKRIAVVPDVLAHQRRGAGDTLSVTREKSWHCFYDALIALRERLIQENVFWELEKDYINYCLHFCLWNVNTLAEPTHTLLVRKLCQEWFAELGIAGKPESYFYNYREYVQYKKMTQNLYITDNQYEKTAPDIEPQAKFHQFETVIEENIKVIQDLQTACTVNKAFDSVRDQLMLEPKVWQASQAMYWKMKYQKYRFACDHLNGSDRDVYRNRMSRELKRAMQLDQLDKEAFSPKEWNEIRLLIARSEGRLARIKKNKFVVNCCCFLRMLLRR